MKDTQGKIAYRNVSGCGASGKMCDSYQLQHSFTVCTVRVADSLAPTEVEFLGGVIYLSARVVILSTG